MKLRKFFLLGLLLLFCSCATKIPLKKAEFYNAKKVGIVLTVDSIQLFKKGSQGLLDMALTVGTKYEKPLLSVEKQINFKKDIEKKLNEIFIRQNKKFEYINITPEVLKSLNKFKNEGSDEYPELDFRPLKETYNIDEILFINGQYGILVNYTGFIESGRMGYAEISNIIINLEDNSYLEKEWFTGKDQIKGRWKGGENYANLKNAIQESINKALMALETGV